jgi:DNA-directed RNA polymerase specialized sigma24 family protein
MEDQRLDLISTRWTLLERAHHGSEDAAGQARAHLLERYGGAVRRYLLGASKNADAADDLFQDFAYRFLHGDFKGACPEKGRFRDFLKGVLVHQVADFCKRRGKQLPNLPRDFPEPAAPQENELNQLFLESWRDDLLARTWQSLADLEKLTGKPLHTILRYRANHPELRSPELAEQLAALLERTLTAVGVRQLLHRAREQFAELLRQHVAASLAGDDPEDVNQELQDLGLLPYVRN